MAARGVLLFLPEVVHNFMQLVGFSPIMSDCPLNSLKAFPAYSQWTEVQWLYERCAAWHPHNAATGKLYSIHPSSIRRQKRAVDGFFIPVRSRKFPSCSAKLF